MRSKILKVVFGVFLSIVFLSALPLTAAADKPGFVVGVSAALTGVAKDFGTGVVNGFILAKEDNPELFSDINFIFEDDRYDPKTAVSIFHRFRSKNVALNYVAGVAPSSAVAPLVDRYALPTLINCQDSNIGQSSHYVIRTVNSSEQYSKKILDHLRTKGFKKIAVISTQSAYYDALLKGLTDNLKKDESILSAGVFNSDELDFKTSISRVKYGHYDALGVYLFPDQLNSFFRQMRQYDLTLPIFGSDVFESRNEIKQAQGAMEGAVFAFNQVDDEFAKRYLARFGNDIQISSAANAYDVANLIAKLVANNKNKIPSNKEILNFFQNVRNELGVLGKFSYRYSPSEGQYFEFPIKMKVIKNSNIEVITD